MFLGLLPISQADPLAAFREVNLVQWCLLIGTGMIGIGIGDTLYLNAIKHLGVGKGMALCGVNPLITLAVERFCFGKSFSSSFVAGALLVVFGVAMLSTAASQKGAFSVADSLPLVGVASALGAALLWGVSTALLKPAIEGLTPIQANSVRHPLVALMMFLPLAIRRRSWRPRRIDWRTVTIVAATGVTGMGIGSYLFLWAVDLIGPARTTTLLGSSQVFGFIMAAVFLREEVRIKTAFGVLLTACGVWLALN
jgi:drug/metabolite transporter (DMT)-like permease